MRPLSLDSQVNGSRKPHLSVFHSVERINIHQEISSSLTNIILSKGSIPALIKGGTELHSWKWLHLDAFSGYIFYIFYPNQPFSISAPLAGTWVRNLAIHDH